MKILSFPLDVAVYSCPVKRFIHSFSWGNANISLQDSTEAYNSEEGASYVIIFRSYLLKLTLKHLESIKMSTEAISCVSLYFAV